VVLKAGSVKKYLRDFKPPEMAVLMAMALLVGLGTGLGSLVFRHMIDFFQWIAFDVGRTLLFDFLGKYYVVLLPSIGGLLLGPIVYFFAREAAGHGVPEVMQAVALRGGRIRPIVVLVKTLASAICIGFGGSAGREGPIVQIGASLGSTFGQYFNLSADRIRMLVACGAAGGIAATFNAPVAGVIFALEVILGEFAVRHFSTVVVASVTASVVSQIFIGNETTFIVPIYSMHSSWEFGLYILLGLLAAPVGVGFSRILNLAEDFFEQLKAPEYLKPAIGAIGVGVIGIWLPEIFGVGYESMEQVLRSESSALLWVGLLLVFKIIATSLTLGSGGSGGIFAPALFIGAMFGAFFGNIVIMLFPGMTASSGAYAIVAMAAVFSAAARAPITAVLILFEMTGDYRIILPLMLATVIATTVAGYLDKESIYTLKLSRKGIRLFQGRDIDLMQSIRVSEVMTSGTDPVLETMGLKGLIQHFQTHRLNSFPVLSVDGDLTGIISLADLDKALNDDSKNSKNLTVGDMSSHDLVTICPEDEMSTALERMRPKDLGILPVIDRRNPCKLIGVIRRRDIVRAYHLSSIRKMDIKARVAQAKLVSHSGNRFAEYEVKSGSAADGQPLAVLPLPKGCIVVSILREERLMIPRGNTVMQAGDILTVFVETEQQGVIGKLFKV
jgi:chloride channel protein, CIC family